METVFQIAAICLLAAVLTALLKKNSPELALLLALAAVVAALFLLSGELQSVAAFLRRLMQAGGISTQLFTPLFKTVAIALVSRVGADLCRDTGESAMASLVDMAGAFGAIMVALPLFEAVWEILQTLI